jgi:hypothetical protein
MNDDCLYRHVSRELKSIRDPSVQVLSIRDAKHRQSQAILNKRIIMSSDHSVILMTLLKGNCGTCSGGGPFLGRKTQRRLNMRHSSKRPPPDGASVTKETKHDLTSAVVILLPHQPLRKRPIRQNLLDGQTDANSRRPDIGSNRIGNVEFACSRVDQFLGICALNSVIHRFTDAQSSQNSISLFAW